MPGQWSTFTSNSYGVVIARVVQLGVATADGVPLQRAGVTHPHDEQSIVGTDGA